MKDIPLARLCSKDYIRTVGRAWEKFVTDRPVEGDDVVRDVVIEFVAPLPAQRRQPGDEIGAAAGQRP